MNKHSQVWPSLLPVEVAVLQLSFYSTDLARTAQYSYVAKLLSKDFQRPVSTLPSGSEACTLHVHLPFDFGGSYFISGTRMSSSLAFKLGSVF